VGKKIGPQKKADHDPELSSDVDIAALRSAGDDPFNHSRWAVHRGGHDR
jgi:hypothetical protein